MQRFFFRLWSVDTRALEFIIGFDAFGWGLWLLLPWETFTTTPSWAVMSQIGPEWVWGCIAFLIGAVQMTAAAYSIWNGNRLARCRYVSAFASIPLWLFVDGAFWFSNPYATGGIIYLALLLAAVWSSLSIAAGRLERRNARRRLPDVQ